MSAWESGKLYFYAICPLLTQKECAILGRKQQTEIILKKQILTRFFKTQRIQCKWIFFFFIKDVEENAVNSGLTIRGPNHFVHVKQ